MGKNQVRISTWHLLFQQKKRKIILKIRPLYRVKHIHTDGFIISDKNTNQLIERYVSEDDLKIVKSGIVSIKNVMNLKWIDFDEIVSPSTKSEKSPIHYLPLPNEILDRIFQYHRKMRTRNYILFY